jgi:hypothetical protein
MRKPFLLFCFLICFLGLKAQPALWESLPLDFNDFPRVMYYDSVDDVSYIAGAFTQVGNDTCNVVKWDGNSYTLLPTCPLHSISCLIRYNGKLYAGGSGQVNLACWDGNSWTSLDSTNSTLVLCFLPYQGKLLVGGNFNSIGGSGIGSVAAWNDTAWSDVYQVDTLLGSSGWSVTSLAEYQDQLYVAGNLNPSNHPEIKEILRFDGTHWTDVGGFQSGNLSYIEGLLVWKDTLYACGLFDETVGSPGNGIAKWDGAHWHKLNNGVMQGGAPAVTDIKIFKDELYITGWFYIVDDINQGLGFKGFAKWNGSQWCTLGAVADNVILSMGNFRDSLYVMGGFDSLNNEPMQYMAKWIGGDYTDSCSSGGVGIPDMVSRDASVFRVFPNPASTGLMVEYEKSHPGKTVVTIKDVLGRTVLRQNAFRQRIGLQNLELDVSGLRPGLYWITVSDIEKRYSRKLMIRN